MPFKTNLEIARRVHRALKTPADKDRKTDPILAFHFQGREEPHPPARGRGS